MIKNNIFLIFLFINWFLLFAKLIDILSKTFGRKGLLHDVAKPVYE